MHLELCHSEGLTPFELFPGETLTTGGGAEDGLQVEGIPAALASFDSDGTLVFVTCREPLTVDGVWAPPRVRRLLLPGETLELTAGVTLRLRPEARPLPDGRGTAAIARELLGAQELVAPLAVPSLTCLTGLDAGRVFYLGEDTVDVGRGLHCALRIRDRAVSRSHARIRCRASAWRVEDLQTPNGTFLNNVPLLEPQELRPGAILEVGFTLLRFDAPVQARPAVGDSPSASAPSVEATGAPPAGDGEANRADWMLMATGGALALLGTGVSWVLASGPVLH